MIERLPGETDGAYTDRLNADTLRVLADARKNQIFAVVVLIATAVLLVASIVVDSS